jgi:hypothetical protein
MIARSPTSVGKMRNTRGSRPDLVCIRVSKQTRWMRCRDKMQHTRRVTCRRAGGSTVTSTAVMVTMTIVQVAAAALSSSQMPAAATTQAAISVRNRHTTPAALRCTWTNI